jgi:hypothetical protein
MAVSSLSRIDWKTIATFRLIAGIVLKTMGYMVIAAGIFISLRSRELALKIVEFGVLMVIFGWILVVIALKRKQS